MSWDLGLVHLGCSLGLILSCCLSPFGNWLLCRPALGCVAEDTLQLVRLHGHLGLATAVCCLRFATNCRLGFSLSHWLAARVHSEWQGGPWELVIPQMLSLGSFSGLLEGAPTPPCDGSGSALNSSLPHTPALVLAGWWLQPHWPCDNPEHGCNFHL